MIQKIYQHLCGYHTDDCADDLRYDPLFNHIFKNKVASQPTLSRVNDEVNKEMLELLQQVNLEQLDTKYSLQKPSKVVLDCDSSHVPTYGEQELANYNAHYQEVGYHPLLLFDGETGDFIKADLRKGSAYTSTGVVDFIKPIIDYYKNQHIDDLYFRGDSGFATPHLYGEFEKNDNQVIYVIRLKANNILHEAVHLDVNEFLDSDQLVKYVEFKYQANSWDKERRVVCKIEKLYDELIPTLTFIVTNDSKMTPRGIFDFYLERGTMENFIKESKLGFNLKNLSSSSFITNYYHMYVKLLAYNLNNFFRQLALSPDDQGNRIETLRTKLIKIAAKFVKTGRQVYLRMSEAFPYKKLYERTYHQIKSINVHMA